MRVLVMVLVGTAAISFWLLTIFTYLFTAYIAYTVSFPAVLLTLAFPVAAQLYWIVALWVATGTPLHSLTMLCLIWLSAGILAFGLSFAQARLEKPIIH